jgi:putative zinc finger/helix-turn-helix YgiT family protein
MNCANCGSKELKTVKVGSYHYLECGLSNIYLQGLSAYECSKCKEQEIIFPNLEGLHALIAKDIASQASRLKPAEIRFLRVHLGLSGADFAKAVSVEPETVSRWENGKSPMKLSNEKLLRLLILANIGPFREYRELGEYGSSSKKGRMNLQFTVSNSKNWQSVAA